MTAAYSFGRFQVNPASRQLLVDGQPAPLGTRAFDVLLILIERRDRLVTKEELLELAWPGLVVEENNLQVQISALRKIIGDQIIRTVPGHGYQFTGQISPSDASMAGRTMTRWSNLPRPLTRFVGHEADLNEYQNVIATSRLITLTGVGGCGKTRLAIELASRTVPMFAQGARFVDLAPMADPERVPLVVARTLLVQEESGRPILETLCDHLAGQQVLIILDNCEHLLGACAALVHTLLGRSSWLKILATSREALGVAGEYTLRVRSLFCPPPQQTDTLDHLRAFEAMQLFEDRARLIRRDFKLEASNAETVAEICRRLDGIPLAIELAAARTRTLSVSELNRKLDDRFRLLVGGSRMAPARQQTLLATIKWSFDLLSPAEQEVLCRVAVFAGGWSLEAAEEICSDEGIEKVAMLDLLTSLTDKCLAMFGERDGTTRYEMLETVRQYAHERLRERGEVARWRDRHLAYFLQLAEKAEPHLSGSEQNAWLDRLDTEHANIRAALTWSTDAGRDAVSCLRLSAALLRLWRLRGYYTEGRSALAAALAAAPENDMKLLRAKALWAAGTLAMDQGDPVAVQAFEQSLTLYRDLQDLQGIASALHGLGYMAHRQGNLGHARLLQEEVVAIMRETADPEGTAKALHNLGNTLIDLRELATGRALLEESLTLSRQLGDRLNVVFALINLGLVIREEGDLAAALLPISEGLSLSRELGDPRSTAIALVCIASCEFAKDQVHEAVRIWGAAGRLIEEIGYALPPTEQARRERELAAARAALGDDAYGQAFREGYAMTTQQAVQYALDLRPPSTR